MKNSYFLPAIVTCLIHATLMLGFTPTKTPPQPVKAPTPPDDNRPTVTVVDLDPEEPEPLVEATSSKVPDVVETRELRPASGDGSNLPPTTPITSAIEGLWSESCITVERSGGPINGLLPLGIGDLGTPIVGVRALDRMPRATNQSMPSYPPSLKLRGETGTVVVEFVVDEAGRVTSPRVLSATHSDLVGPTLSAVARWRFEPGRRQGVPVKFRMTQPVVFSLTDE